MGLPYPSDSFSINLLWINLHDFPMIPPHRSPLSIYSPSLIHPFSHHRWPSLAIYFTMISLWWLTINQASSLTIQSPLIHHLEWCTLKLLVLSWDTTIKNGFPWLMAACFLICTITTHLFPHDFPMTLSTAMAPKLLVLSRLTMAMNSAFPWFNGNCSLI